MEKTILFIIGMHRSGTSAITRLVSKLGYDPGQNLMSSNEYNKNGYYEDLDVYNLNNRILGDLNLNWDTIEDEGFRRIEILNNFILNKYKKRAIQILENKLENSNNVVVKDPRFSVLLPFWNDITTRTNIDIKVLITVRNPLDVAMSLKKRNGIKIDEGLKLWYFNYNCIFKNINTTPFIIDYDDIVNKQEAIGENFAAFLGSDTKNLINIINEVINKDLCHNISSKEEIDLYLNKHPQVNSLYSKIKSINNILEADLKSIIDENLKDGLPGKVNNGNVILSSNLFYSTVDDSTSPGRLEVKHGIGYAKLRFELARYEQVESCNLFLCDSQCVVRIERIGIETENGSFDISEFNGNYIFRNGDCYLFSTNIPEIKFNIDTPHPVKTIEFDIVCEVNRTLVAELLASVQSFFIEKLKDDMATFTRKKGILEDGNNEEGTIYYESENVGNNEIEHINYNFEINQLQREKETLTSLNDYLSARAKADRMENDNLKKRIDELLTEVTSLFKSLENEKDKYVTVHTNNRFLEKEKSDLEQQIKKLEKENSKLQQEVDEKTAKAEYLWRIKLTNENEISGLKKEIHRLKQSVSWYCSYPVRLFGRIIMVFVSPVKFLFKDTIYAFELLKREGFKVFVYRFCWYLRGKRLNEDIYLANNKSELKKLTERVPDTKRVIELPEVNNPLVSIIIPAYNNWEYTYRCIN